MIQLFCPACENVVWVESADTGDATSCPECNQPIHSLSRRKSRPLAEAPHVGIREEKEAASSLLPPPLPLPPAEDEAVEEAEIDPEEEDLSAEHPESECLWRESVRFVPLPYRAEGGCSLVRLPLFVAGVLLGGLFFGWLASTLGQVCYLILLFPLGVGMALAYVGGAAVRWARVRNPTLAAAVGLAGGTLAVLTMHQCDYQQTRRHLRAQSAAVPDVVRQRLGTDDSLRGYLDAVARVGVTVCDRGDTGFNLGYYGSWVYWGAELVVVAGLALFGTRAASVRPFCAGCGSWKGERVLGSLRESDTVLPLMRRGDLAGLDGGSAAGGRGVSLSAAACSRCGTEAPIDVRLERLAAVRGRPTGELAYFSYPGEALSVLEQVFRGPM